VTVNQNILLTRLKSIGDILFTLPAVGQVRAAFPEAEISFLVSKEYASLLQGFRDVDAVIALDRALYRHASLMAVAAELVSLLRRLRAQKFSMVVDFQGYGETALLTRLTGAPQRWGAVYRGSRRWAYTKGPTADPGLHPADWNLTLLRQCGLQSGPVRNEFHLPPDASAAAVEFLRQHRLDPAGPILFIQPFTNGPHKVWPLEKFLALARTTQDSGLQVMFGGGPADRTALEPAIHAGFTVSAGVPLLTSAALMGFAQVVVGPDTGLLHLAVALGKRVVMIIHATSPGFSFPYQHPEWTVTPPPGQPLSSIRVEQVLTATAQALAEAGATGARHVKSAAS